MRKHCAQQQQATSNEQQKKSILTSLEEIFIFIKNCCCIVMEMRRVSCQCASAFLPTAYIRIVIIIIIIIIILRYGHTQYNIYRYINMKEHRILPIFATQRVCCSVCMYTQCTACIPVCWPCVLSFLAQRIHRNDDDETSTTTANEILIPTQNGNKITTVVESPVFLSVYFHHAHMHYTETIR